MLRGAVARGHACAGLKPILTGHDLPDDVGRLGEASGRRVEPLYRFGPPVSPHLAARMAGVSISLGGVTDWVTAEAKELTLIETAGGAFSPLSASLTNLDLALALAPARVVLVANGRLGVLHDVAATILGCRHLAPALEWSAVVISSLDAELAIVSAREVRNVVLPRLGCSAPVVSFGPAGELDEAATASFLDACLPGFT